MKRIILLSWICIILSAPLTVSGVTVDPPLQFSFDVSNEVLVDIVNSIEHIINSSLSSEKNGNTFSFKWQDVDLYDQFYDVPELILLTNSVQLFQRTFVNQYVTSKKGKQKKTKDNILFVNHKEGELVFKEKKYNKVKELWGKHPLLGKIKRKERGLLGEKLNEIAVKTPLRLKKILNIRSIGKKLIVKQNDLDILNIEILSHNIDSLKTTIPYSSVHFSSKIKEGDLSIVKQISSGLVKHLVSYNQNSKAYLDNRYKHAYSLLSDETILLNFKIGHPALVRLIYSLGWFVFGCILIFVFFRKRMIS